VFWPLSWPVTLSLFDLKYWGQTWLVMWSVSSLARTGYFPKLLLGYSLFAVFAANSSCDKLALLSDLSDNHLLGALLEPSLPSRVEREETLNTPLWGAWRTRTTDLFHAHTCNPRLSWYAGTMIRRDNIPFLFCAMIGFGSRVCPSKGNISE